MKFKLLINKGRVKARMPNGLSKAFVYLFQTVLNLFCFYFAHTIVFVCFPPHKMAKIRPLIFSNCWTGLTKTTKKMICWPFYYLFVHIL